MIANSALEVDTRSPAQARGRRGVILERYPIWFIDCHAPDHRHGRSPLSTRGIAAQRRHCRCRCGNFSCISSVLLALIRPRRLGDPGSICGPVLRDDLDPRESNSLAGYQKRDAEICPQRQGPEPRTSCSALRHRDRAAPRTCPVFAGIGRQNHKAGQKTRLLGGIRNKAARGELRRGLPVGFVWGDEDGEVRFHPDEAVCVAIRTVFARFAELGSVRRVWLWLRTEGLSFPMQTRYGGGVRWVVRPRCPLPSPAEPHLSGRGRTQGRRISG